MIDQKNLLNSFLMLMETACINQNLCPFMLQKNFVLLTVLEKQKKQRWQWAIFHWTLD